MPLFLTSDSLENGFHVFYEESILRLERANARKLGGILQSIWGNLETADKAFTGKPELVAAARTRDKLTIATAMRLLGEVPVPMEAAVAAVVAEEARRVELTREERGQSPAGWVRPIPVLRPSIILASTRVVCPTKTPALERYFRTVSWLQSVPFRVRKDEELVSILMLGNCVAWTAFARIQFESRRLHKVVPGF